MSGSYSKDIFILINDISDVHIDITGSEPIVRSRTANRIALLSSPDLPPEQLVEIGGSLGKLVDGVQDKVLFLESVLDVGSGQDLMQVKGYTASVGRKAVVGLRNGGKDTGAVDLALVVFANKTELDGIPVEAGDLLDDLFLVEIAFGDHRQFMKKVCDAGVGEQRDMAEGVVEHIGFFEVVKLLFFTEPGSGTKVSVGHEHKELTVGNEAGDGVDLPAGALEEVLVDILEERDAFGIEAQGLKPGGEMVIGEGLDGS